VLFAYNSHSLLPASYPELDKLAELMLNNPNITAEVSGHTDNIGSDSYNLELSKKRAESVVVYLIVKGVPRARLSAKGYGSEKPIADNATEEGRALNRRTEFHIIGQ
jgi:outer membrane protein OmpA-like peptidoglycan-associated protein